MKRSWLLSPAVALVLVLSATAVPYLAYFPLWPGSLDSAVWVAGSSPTNPEWLRFVFATSHGGRCYRPVVGLSYAFDSWVGGFSSVPYRATSTALHLVCGLLVYFLFRRLAPGLSRWGGVAAATVLLMHPLSQVVVSELSRRAYSLCTLLGLSALLLLAPAGARGAPARPAGRAVLAALLLAAAILSHELAVTYVLAAALVLLYVVLDDRSRARWAVLAGIGVFAAAAASVGIRALVVEGVGGYPERARDVGEAAVSAWQSMVVWRAPGSPAGRVLLAAGAVGVGLFYAANARFRVPALSLAWLLGYTVVAAAVGRWFPREAYVALAPFALLCGSALALTLRSFDRTRLRSWFSLVPQAALAAWLLLGCVESFSFHAERLARNRRIDALLRDLHGSLVTHGRPAAVALVLPRYVESDDFGDAWSARRPTAAYRQPETWVNALLRDSQTTVESRLAYMQDPTSPPMRPEVQSRNGGIELVLPRGLKYFASGSESVTRTGDGREVVRFVPGTDGRDQLLYFHDGRSGRLIPFGGEDR